MDDGEVFKLKTDSDYARLTVAAVAIPLTIAVIVSLTIAVSDGIYPCHFCGSHLCWSYFVEVFKVPLSIAGLSILFGTMALTLRRAFQGQRQLERFDDQEKLTIHLKNKEFFISEFRAKFPETDRQLEIEIYQIFDNFYPLEQMSGVDANLLKSAIEKLKATADLLTLKLAELQSSPDYPYISDSDCGELVNALSDLERTTLINIRHASLTNLPEIVGTPSYSIQMFTQPLGTIFDSISKTLRFTLLFDHKQTLSDNKLIFDELGGSIAKYTKLAIEVDTDMSVSSDIYNMFASKQAWIKAQIASDHEQARRFVKKLLSENQITISPRRNEVFQFLLATNPPDRKLEQWIVDMIAEEI